MKSRIYFTFFLFYVCLFSFSQSDEIVEEETDLEEITINYNKKTSKVSFLGTQNITTLTSDELLKAACCNLAESFETTPSIDVNFSDAISGSKQIKMLGLSSPNILISIENIPSIRGALQSHGLNYIPGTWIESIQITKGAGSVVNGYESITGQINAELRKPINDDKFFLNFYASEMERLEINTHYNTKLSNNWDYGLYFHANKKDNSDDRNNDGFRDSPTGNQINIYNRFQYTNAEKGLVSFIDFNYVNDYRAFGENGYIDGFYNLIEANTYWGGSTNSINFKTNFKLGYVNPKIPYQSLGFQFSYSNFSEGSDIGFSIHDIDHESIYSNIVYNSIIGDTRHKIKTGISFTYDNYDEFVDNMRFQTFNLDRKEHSFGGFFEYNFDDLDKINLSAGIRYDNHNVIGGFLTPRLHLNYLAFPKTSLKFSVGKGTRMANIFSENHKLFYSSRLIFFGNSPFFDSGNNYFDLEPESAWNYGLSLTNSFRIFNNNAQFILDYYFTDFENQVVVDWETPSGILFYNLQGKSYAESFQAQLQYTLSNNISILSAYKISNVKTNYISGQLDKPLTPKNRFFLNFAYDGNKNSKGANWKYDLTYNLIGEQRFPSTENSPIEYRMDEFTPDITLVNTQLTRVFNKSFETYLGIENLTNYKQMNPIISSEDPFGQYFDSTFVYGPIFGRMYYLGLRYRIN